MESCRLVAESIEGVDNDIVTFCNMQRRNRPLSIDANDGSTIFITLERRYVDPGDVEVVYDSGSKRSPCEQGEERQRDKEIGWRKRHYRTQNFIDRIKRNFSEKSSRLLADRKHSKRLHTTITSKERLDGSEGSDKINLLKGWGIALTPKIRIKRSRLGSMRCSGARNGRISV